MESRSKNPRSLVCQIPDSPSRLRMNKVSLVAPERWESERMQGHPRQSRISTLGARIFALTLRAGIVQSSTEPVPAGGSQWNAQQTQRLDGGNYAIRWSAFRGLSPKAHRAVRNRRVSTWRYCLRPQLPVVGPTAQTSAVACFPPVHSDISLNLKNEPPTIAAAVYAHTSPDHFT